MTTEVYASQNGTDYFRLDLLKDESILMKYTYKDTQDLSKIYSPYSQSFTLQGSLNNQKILGYLGETKILKSKSNNVFDCKIYNNGLLSKKGLLKVTEVRYEDGKVKTFTANFTTGMLSLKDRFGEDKISDLGSALIQWDNFSVKNYINGINTKDGVKFIVPFSSNSRVWQVADINNANALDNIAYNPNADKNGDNFIKINELSPAISFAYIMGLIKSKYDLDVIMPIESEDYYNDLYVSCNKINGTSTNGVYYDFINAFNFVRFEVVNGHIGPNTPLFTTGIYPTIPKYTITGNAFTDNFSIKINANYTPFRVLFVPPTARFFYDENSSYLGVFFENVINTKSNENIQMSVSIELLNGVLFKSETKSVTNGQASVDFRFKIDDSVYISNSFDFKIKVFSDNPITWSRSVIHSYYRVVHNWNSTNPFVNRYFFATYGYESICNNSSTMNMSSIDLLKSVPDIKITDFLTSFFKTFNLSVFETSPDDGRLYWLTPKDIKAENKEYSGNEIDYTDYVVSDKVNKQIANDYNYYNFKHKTPKYKSNADYIQFFGREFGQLTYPTIKPTRDLNEYKIETNFSIVQNVGVSGLITGGGEAKTYYGFTNETPTRQPNNALRYKPNTEDFTLFFYNGQVAPRTPYLGYLNVYPNGTKVIEPLNAVTIVGSVHNLSGFSLGFGLIENATIESLYENFYKDQTERLLEPNTLQHSFSLQLPPIELVLNYANTKQGQSNIPSGFRLQNDIIIQDVRYSIIDATIDQTTGKTTLNLLNYV